MPGGVSARMDNASDYAHRPIAFIWRYVAGRPLAHAIIVISVLAAVGCSVGAQYGIKVLVDILSVGVEAMESADVWWAFLLLVSLVAFDNALWRVAAWIASSTF